MEDELYNAGYYLVTHVCHAMLSNYTKEVHLSKLPTSHVLVIKTS